MKPKEPITSGNWVLIHEKSGTIVCVGETIKSRNGNARITGGRPPQHAGSSGRVWIGKKKSFITNEYFPHVFDLKWIQD